MAVPSLRRARSRLKSGIHRRWPSAVKKRSPRRLRSTIARYRGARQFLHGPVSRRSRRGLDWMNFFVADAQTGFGPFVAFYLASLGWSKESVGLALTVSGLAGVVAQIPGGALADANRRKRALAAAGILMMGSAALILALWPAFVPVLAAEVLHGASGGIVGPAITAISLGLVGRRAMSIRTGRNFRFNAAGIALTAAAMGLLGNYLAESAIFLAAAGFCIPALVALGRIRASEIDYDRARNAAPGERARNLQRVMEMGKNRALLVFAACTVLFQLADASMLPVVGEDLAQSKAALGPIVMSGLIIVPAIIVAVLAPWVGYHSERWGRKPLLVLGYGLEVVRAILFALVSGVPALILVQVFGGISSAMITVLTVLVVTDVTAGTGRFNLARGFLGTLTSIAAAVSTVATGYIFQQFGHRPGFLVMAALAGAATAILWLFLPETKPGEYLD